MDAPVNAEAWKKYFSLPLFESENSEHKRIHSRHDGVPHRNSNMFTVGKQRSVWTVSIAIYSANISFPVSSQQKEPDTGGPPLRLQHHFGTSLLNRMLLSNSHNSLGPHGFPRSYVCLFTTAFGPPRPKSFVKVWRKKVMGKTPISICNRQDWMALYQTARTAAGKVLGIRRI